MGSFNIKYKDLYELYWDLDSRLGGLNDKIGEYITALEELINPKFFTGNTSEAMSAYFKEVHIVCLKAIQAAAQNLMDTMVGYKAGYYGIDMATNFVIPETSVNSVKNELSGCYASMTSEHERIKSALSSISDLASYDAPSIDSIETEHTSLDTKLKTLVDDINSFEESTVQSLEDSTKIMIENFRAVMGLINQMTFFDKDSYIPGSVSSQTNFYLMGQISDIMVENHNENAELLKVIMENETALKEAAEARETRGIWAVIGGVTLIVTGTACIFFTAGASSTLIAAGGFLIGGTTTIFGVADVIEGGQDIYYGSAGNIDDKSINVIRDTVFMGNQKVYNVTENVFAFAASAMAPIGKASSAGILNKGVVVKAVVSEGAGEAAGRITNAGVTKLSGNETIGMISGMIASSAASSGVQKFFDRPKPDLASLMSPEDAARYEGFFLSRADGNNLPPGMDVDDFNRFQYGLEKVEYGQPDIQNYTYNMYENPGPLLLLENGKHIKNFYGGRYNIEVLQQDTILYRAGDVNGSGYGQYYVTEPPISQAQVRIDSAVKAQWIDVKTGHLDGKSPLNTVYAVKIPKGTSLYTGPVAPQGGVYLGGSNVNQIFIFRPWEIPGAEVLGQLPLS